jgi:hypothetical protein
MRAEMKVPLEVLTPTRTFISALISCSHLYDYVNDDSDLAWLPAKEGHLLGFYVNKACSLKHPVMGNSQPLKMKNRREIPDDISVLGPVLEDQLLTLISSGISLLFFIFNGWLFPITGSIDTCC